MRKFFASDEFFCRLFFLPTIIFLEKQIFFRQIFAEDFFYQRNFMPNFFSSEKVTEIDGSTT